MKCIKVIITVRRCIFSMCDVRIVCWWGPSRARAKDDDMSWSLVRDVLRWRRMKWSRFGHSNKHRMINEIRQTHKHPHQVGRKISLTLTAKARERQSETNKFCNICLMVFEMIATNVCALRHNEYLILIACAAVVAAVHCMRDSSGHTVLILYTFNESSHEFSSKSCLFDRSSNGQYTHTYARTRTIAIDFRRILLGRAIPARMS